MKSIIIGLFCLLSLVFALNNGLALTPPLEISTLSQGCAVNEESVKKEADLLASSGLLANGFKYLLIEDCWQVIEIISQLERDSASKRLKEDPNKFPSGLPNLINYIHSKGLLIGLGSDIGTLTRSGKPGSSGF
jgi:alpha-galactosidase